MLRKLLIFSIIPFLLTVPATAFGQYMGNVGDQGQTGAYTLEKALEIQRKRLAPEQRNDVLIELDRISILGIREESTSLEVWLKITNPKSETLYLEELVFTIYEQNQQIVESEIRQPKPIELLTDDPVYVKKLVLIEKSPEISYLWEVLENNTAQWNVDYSAILKNQINYSGEARTVAKLDFVDPNKDPTHYVTRYLNEPEYKEWFDRNYPDYTIYEAVGMSEEDYQKYIAVKIDPEPEPTSSKGGGCLIATATFDSELAPQVQKLREIRDSKLLSTESGSQFMESFNSFYYSFSPIIADYERENPVFKELVKIAITPMLSTLSLMDYADTESEVLGIGISLIILNGILYVGLPVFGIMIARKRF